MCLLCIKRKFLWYICNSLHWPKKTSFSALMLLVGRQDWVVGLVWLSVWNEVQTCIWPSWCHCHSLSLASVKSRLVLPLWYRLTWVVPDKGPLNGCVCVCALTKKRFRAHNLAAVWGDCKFFFVWGNSPPPKKRWLEWTLCALYADAVWKFISCWHVDELCVGSGTSDRFSETNMHCDVEMSWRLQPALWQFVAWSEGVTIATVMHGIWSLRQLHRSLETSLAVDLGFKKPRFLGF